MIKNPPRDCFTTRNSLSGRRHSLISTSTCSQNWILVIGRMDLHCPPAHPPAAMRDDDGPVNLLPEWDFGNWEDGLPVHPPAAVREDVGSVDPIPELDGEEDGLPVHRSAAVREDVGPVNPFPEP